LGNHNMNIKLIAMTITMLNYLEALPVILHDKFLEMVNRETKQNLHRPILYENNTLFYEPLG
jgi:hypothetical protein